jgi:ferritin-like metal-binding protein YciE
MAEQIGNHEAAQLLEETLKEEEATDEKLTEIAKSIYEDAKGMEEETEDEEVEEEEDVEA